MCHCSPLNRYLFQEHSVTRLKRNNDVNNNDANDAHCEILSHDTYILCARKMILVEGFMKTGIAISFRRWILEF